MEFLGRTVSGQSLSVTDADIEVVKNWPEPKCSKDVEKFMGLANYHRGFVKHFAMLAELLYKEVVYTSSCIHNYRCG